MSIFLNTKEDGLQTLNSLFNLKLDSSIEQTISFEVEEKEMTIYNFNLSNPIDDHIKSLFYDLPIDEWKDFRYMNKFETRDEQIRLNMFKSYQNSKYSQKYRLALGDKTLFYDGGSYSLEYYLLGEIVDPNFGVTKKYHVNFGFKLDNPNLVLHMYEDKDEYKIYLREAKLDKLK